MIEAAALAPADVSALEALLPKLDAIVQRKDAREQERSRLSAQLDTLALSLESAFHHSRARARAAVGREAAALKTALSILPRRTERRSAAAPTPQPAD